jgi:hypothetical protein
MVIVFLDVIQANLERPHLGFNNRGPHETPVDPLAHLGHVTASGSANVAAHLLYFDSDIRH